MKKICLILLVLAVTGFAQFREKAGSKPSIQDGIISNNSSPNLILGFINPNNFHMSHSYNLSYSAFGNQGLALGVYTNTMSYKFTDKLNIQVDASLVNSPYNTFGKNFTNQINGIYLSRAELNYKPWDNFHINVQYNSYPFGNSYYSPFGYSRYFNRGYTDDWMWDR